jgi:hypothetical protein
MVQYHPRPARSAGTGHLSPYRRTGHPGRAAGHLPARHLEQEMSDQRWIDIPEQVRDIYTMWRPSPHVPGTPPGKGPGDTGQDLLQVRRGLSGRLPQAQLGHPPGLLQQAGRHQAPGHRDRRRPVGQSLSLACSLFGWNARSTWSRSPTSRSRTASR